MYQRLVRCEQFETPRWEPPAMIMFCRNKLAVCTYTDDRVREAVNEAAHHTSSDAEVKYLLILQTPNLAETTSHSIS